YRLVANGLCSAPASETGTLSGDVVRPAPRLGPRLVHASSSCGADGRFAVGAAGALKDFPVCQRATQAMSVVTLIRGWVLARHRRLFNLRLPVEPSAGFTGTGTIRTRRNPASTRT